ncbi:dimethylaniline monooxygenase [N-oxide-forming] 5-like isoform X2 [Amblyraja radiata]|uniref:dimethylaniline monooxygenase [N-oxide-forming] 5-like isoform X2 n=2 Tax=Amblyraja radiata TaxID=386614 RepID=UPI001401FDD0|nr:dimethylaniline monooxygenase [N-oxide-forming] 5-like isoform X2 [Amblyraja radiata]
MKIAKRIAIIGAGASGLTSVKCCLDEGLQPTCFERSDDIGGLWNYQVNSSMEHPGIYKTLIINTSKEMMCFSDFPIPDDYANFMHNSKILRYFRAYAENFNLMKYIRLKTNVCNIMKEQDFSTNGQWTVTTKDEDGNIETSVYDAVMICTGHHCNPHTPLDSFPGITSFTGQYIHSKEYKDPQLFEGKNVVVIVIGNSGADLSVEISQTAKQVFLSTRRGSWVLNRVGSQGYPGDMVSNRRSAQLLKDLIPQSILKCFVERSLNKRFNHVNYGLQPGHSIFSQHPMVNDDLPTRIISGRVLVKPNVKSFTETTAIFADGSVEEIDFVVFATGYTFSYPFLDESVVKVEKNQVDLYKLVFPPAITHPTLCIIGLMQPVGAIMPLSELQARWATRVFKGDVKLPSTADMTTDTMEKKEKMSNRYVKSPRHTIQVDYIAYADELADLIGARPNLKSLAIRDPRLAYHVFFGPCTPCQYRLAGPRSWGEARETILTTWDRAIRPTKTRILVQSRSDLPIPLFFNLLAFLLAICAILYFF